MTSLERWTDDEHFPHINTAYIDADGRVRYGLDYTHPDYHPVTVEEGDGLGAFRELTWALTFAVFAAVVVIAVLVAMGKI